MRRDAGVSVRLLLEHLLEHGWSTQTEIADAIGMSRQGINKLLTGEFETALKPERASLQKLLDRRVRRRPGSRSGRPHDEYAMPRDIGRILSVDFGSKHIRVRTGDFRGKVHGQREEERLDVVGQPSAALAAAAEQIKTEVRNLAGGQTALAGIVVGLPFAVFEDKARDRGPWRDRDVTHELTQLLKWKQAPPMRVSSDAALGALAERDALRADPEHGASALARSGGTICYVKFSSAVSGANVVDGAVLTGSAGFGDAFLHMPVERMTSAPCPQCGRVCVSSFASLRAVFDDMATMGKRLEGADSESRARSLMVLARHDTDVEERLRLAATTLGAALGHAANVIDPDVLVIGGAFTDLQDANDVNAWIRQGLDEVVHPGIGHRLQLLAGRETGRAAVVGGVILGREQFAVDYLLRQLVPDQDAPAERDDDSPDKPDNDTPPASVNVSG